MIKKLFFLLITLSIFLFNCIPAFASETYKISNVLVSPRKQTFSIGSSTIRIETRKVNDCFISRPSQVDMKISDLLKANNIKSIKDYAKWLSENVKYKSDRGHDIWTSPEETLRRKYGDCEDFAFLNLSVLRVLGYKSKVLAMEEFGFLMGRFINNHAICVFEKNGLYLWFDNGTLKETNASSIKEFAAYIFKKYSCYSISEVSFETRKWDTLFTRPEVKDLL